MDRLPFLKDEDWEHADVLWGFSQRYLRMRYDAPKPIPPIHKEWWALCLSDYPQVAIAAPREHAKSTAITFAYVLYILMERKAHHLLLLGSNETLAISFVNELRVELTENDLLRDEYGFQGFVKETEAEIVGEFAGGARFRVIAKGAGQRMRGIKWERKRPDACVFDDMEDEELVLNEGRRDRFRRWFYGTVRPILRGGGKIRGVGTIIGFDSLLERMMPSEKDAGTVIEPLRTYSREPDGWASVKYRAHNEDFTQILWEDQKSGADLKRIRSEYVSMGMADIYGQEYLNCPIDTRFSFFRSQDFLPMEPKDFETRKVYYAAGDLAIGETERNAYTVFVVGGLDTEGFLNIVDIRRARIDGEQIVDEMFSIHARWDLHLLRMESENIEKAIGPFLYRKMDETQIYLPIDSKSPTKDKDKRARSIQARMRAGKVRFNKNAEWYPDLEEEMTKYPRFPYKDQVDAMAWLGLMLEEMIEPPTDEEVDEDEYQTMVATDYDSGRCQTTGY